MSAHPHDADVAALMRAVAAAVIMPRFRTLAASDIVEKSPGELVTVADRAAEERLTAGLLAIEDLPVVGEEAVAADPSLLDGIGAGRRWLVDPIDGTANYAAGRPPFGLMIALVEDGRPAAGWLLDPLTDRLCHAQAGGGAYMNGDRLIARTTGRARPVITLSSALMGADERAAIEGRVAPIFDLAASPRCAAEQYPRLCLGENDVALFRRSLPWDHAPGALFLAEAGGRVARLDGSDYRLGDGRTGLLATASPRLWDEAARVLGDAP